MVDTSVSPYYDDFDEDKQFHRLLFRPGRAVQARELTQLQTILSNQITRFGQNIFQEGSVVIPGVASIDTGYEYVKLAATEEIGSLIVGATIVGNSSGMIADVLQIVDKEDSDPVTIYLRYVGGGSSNGGRFQDGETLTWTNPETGSGSFVAGTDATGTGTKIDLQKGIYFVKGVFAVATTQSLIIQKYGIPSGLTEIGLIATESIVTSDSDTSLKDNAQGTNNTNAPGADRLKIALSLIKKEDVLDSSGDTTSDYFTIAMLKDAVIVEQRDRSTYGILGDELARRTYDESGDYTIDPFIVDVEEHPTDDTKLTLKIDPGKAYVKGYEVSKSLVTSLDIDKALSTETKNNGKISTYFGNYVRVNNLSGAFFIHTFGVVNLRDSGDTARGTARVRAITHESGSIYRVYLFDVSMNLGYGFNVVDNLLGADGGSADLVDVGTLYGVDTNYLLFPAPYSRTQTIQDITVRVQRRIVGTATGGALTVDTNDASQTWENTSEWIVIRNDTGAVVSPTYGATGSQTLQLTNLANVEHTVIGYLDKTTATTTARTKTLTTVTDAVLTPAGNDSVDLAQADIFELVSVKDASDSDADITSRYTLDNGQRDNFYQNGMLVLKTGQTAPAGNVKVTFKYFAHGSGDYFTVDSYNSFIGLAEYNYGDIPSHTLANGRSVRLADMFDFRPKKSTAGTDFTSVGAYRNELPLHNSTIQADITYYLPRKDILYIDRFGNFGTVSGNPSLTPSAGQVPDNAMAINVLDLNAATISLTDLKSTFIENRRYTMRDIGAIEARIDRVEETVALSLLESSTATLEVLDGSGNTRFKSGFFVDNFKDHSFADSDNVEYRAAIDPREGLVRPEFYESNVRLYYTATPTDGSIPSNIEVDEDVVLMSYTETPEVVQGLASSSINVNPYNVITNTGRIRLSPETDEWKDTVTTTRTNTIQETNAINRRPQRNWDNWRWSWAGVPDLDNDFVDFNFPFSINTGFR